MAEHSRTDTFTFDADEISLLIAMLGGHSPTDIEKAGHSVDAFERVWEALTGAAYTPLREDSPPRLSVALASSRKEGGT